MDGRKLECVRQYLIGQFGGEYDITDMEDFDHDGQKFRIRKGRTIHLLTVVREWMDDRSLDQIRSHLEQLAVADALRAGDGSLLILNNDPDRPRSPGGLYPPS